VRVVDAGTLRFAPLTIARRAEVLDIPLSEGVSMRFIGRKPSRGYVRWLRRAATETRAVLRSLGAEPPLRGLVVVEAPLRRRLVEIGDGVVFVSDRLFDAERPFWRYEDVHLAQGLFVDALRDRADADEPGTLLPFVLDGVSWSLVDDYLRARWKNHVNLRSLLQRFTFLPAIDVLLETPTFPFADQVFDNPYSMDPLGDDIRRFNRPPRTGRMLMLRLADHVGERSLDGAIAAWIGERSRRPLFAEIEARTGFDATTYAQSFLGDVPRLDLRLLDVERSRDPHGFHLTHVEADRVTLDGTSQDEPVDIVLRAGRGRQVRLVWIGAGEAAWDVRTEHRVGRVTIDPAARLLEVDADGFSLRQDDQLPRPVKLSGYGYFVALNATASSFEAHGVLNVRPAHDHRHGVSAAVFADARTRLGAGLSYARWFGARRFGPYRQQRLVFGADFSWLDERFQPTDSPLQAELRTSWVFENRASSFRPSRGGRAVVTGFLGRDFAPGKESQRAISDGLYGGFDTLGVVLLPLAPFHVLALKGKAGFVVGGRDHTLLPLGGSDDLRGMPEGSGLMSVRAIGVAEWRHDFFRDADLPLLLSRWRGLQGSLFLEGGAGLPTAGGAPVARASFGYGLRWFVDWLGLLPGAFGIDIAWSPGAGPGRWPLFPLTPDRWPEVPFQAYLVGSQSF
jgi:hypothetical protein